MIVYEEHSTNRLVLWTRVKGRGTAAKTEESPTRRGLWGKIEVISKKQEKWRFIAVKEQESANRTIP